MFFSDFKSHICDNCILLAICKHKDGIDIVKHCTLLLKPLYDAACSMKESDRGLINVSFSGIKIRYQIVKTPYITHSNLEVEPLSSQFAIEWQGMLIIRFYMQSEESLIF